MATAAVYGSTLNQANLTSYLDRARSWRFPSAPLLFAASATGIVFIALLGYTFLFADGPSRLSVREHGGQLFIEWAPSAVQRARLEILDGTSRTLVPLSSGLTRLTYASSTEDVEVRLIYPGSHAGSHADVARVLARPNAPQQIAEDLKTLTERVRLIEIAAESGMWRVSQLQRTADRLIERTAQYTSPLKRSKPSDAREGRDVPRSPKRPAPVTWWRD